MYDFFHMCVDMYNLGVKKKIFVFPKMNRIKQKLNMEKPKTMSLLKSKTTKLNKIVSPNKNMIKITENSQLKSLVELSNLESLSSRFLTKCFR